MQQNPCSIKALIFDFGGVLSRTEDQRPRQRLAAQLGLTLEQLYDIVFNSDFARLSEVGELSSEERWQRMGQALGLGSADEIGAFLHEFFSGDKFDEELGRHIRRWRRCYKTALLSNAGDSLAVHVRDRLGLGDAFDEVIISALVGLAKPDPAIFRLALERLGVAPQEAVFVDDMPGNVDAAAALGIHAIRFTTREALLDQLRPLLGEC
ncbi:MAG: HAD family phosphatase [Chloroflexi bacterium]|nr:HAD family phosphatase [Chloroflexota bacterium]